MWPRSIKRTAPPTRSHRWHRGLRPGAHGHEPGGNSGTSGWEEPVTTTASVDGTRRFVSATVVLALTAGFLVTILGLGTGRASAATLHVPAFGVNYRATWGDYTDSE